MKLVFVSADFYKSHVAAYTKKDGTFVAEHEDKRAAAKPKNTEPGLLRDDSGKPIEVHHGSPNDFDEFDEDMVGEGTNSRSEGFWFTDDQLQAWAYADPSGRGKGHMKTVHLLMRNPMVVDAMAEAKRVAEEIGADEPDDWQSASELLAYNDWMADAVKDARRGGHDGLIIKNTGDAPTHSQDLANHYVVFKTDQIIQKPMTKSHPATSAPIRLFLKSHPSV